MARDQDPYALVAKALRTLTDEEQALVLRHVLPAHVLTGSGLVAGAARALPSDPRAARAALAAELALQAAPGGEKVGLLVRLPVETHGRLKSWCDSHGHSMNVVVRGLVEQFLDGHPSG